MMPGSLFSSWLLAFASPKSTIFTSPYFVMSTLGGDMSRWTMWSGDAVRVGQLVGVREALADLEGDVDGGLDREVAPALLDVLDDRLEVRAVDELHDDEERVVADADVEDLDAVRVRELRREARLVEEHRDELLLRRQVRQDALDGDLLPEALEPFALGAEHFGHAARFELLDDAVPLLTVGHGLFGSRGLTRAHPQGCHPRGVMVKAAVRTEHAALPVRRRRAPPRTGARRTEAALLSRR